MGEYILYVILIFIPIGGLMVYLLRKDGLPGKYINIILLLSLLIIFSFPISMEKLGRSVSLMIYVLLLAALAGYLLRARVGSFALFATPEVSAGSEHNGINTALLGPSIPVADNCDDLPSAVEPVEEGQTEKSISEDNYVELVQEEPGEDLSIGNDLGSDEPDERAALKEDNQQLPVEALEPIAAKKPDEIAEVGDEPEEAIEPDIMAEEAVQEAGLEVPGPESLSEMTAWDNQPLDKDAEENIITGANSQVEPQERNDNVGEPEMPEATNTIAGIEEMSGQESKADDELELGEQTPMVSESYSSDTGEPVSAVVPDDKAVETNAPENQVITLIDSAFACRPTNPVEAARYFEEAWHLTSNYELKHLLTVELVEIYKDNGWYKKAMSILDSFIALPNHKSDIINEISRQFDYISLLAAELDRLGISDLPVSRIPRWVRLKVDSEMNPR